MKTVKKNSNENSENSNEINRNEIKIKKNRARNIILKIELNEIMLLQWNFFLFFFWFLVLELSRDNVNGDRLRK